MKNENDMMYLRQIIAKRFIMLRLQAGLTQKQVAEKLGICLKTYKSYEEGKTMMRINKLDAVLELYNISSDYLLGLSDNPTKKQK